MERVFSSERQLAERQCSERHRAGAGSSHYFDGASQFCCDSPSRNYGSRFSRDKRGLRKLLRVDVEELGAVRLEFDGDEVSFPRFGFSGPKVFDVYGAGLSDGAAVDGDRTRVLVPVEEGDGLPDPSLSGRALPWEVDIERFRMWVAGEGSQIRAS